jgi:hypothetical protein
MLALIRCVLFAAAVILIGLGFYVCFKTGPAIHAGRNASVMVELAVGLPTLLAAAD